MKDLGRKTSEMYPSCCDSTTEDKVEHPQLRFPLDFVSSNARVGDEVTLTIKAKIIGLEDTEFNKQVTFKALEGEVA